MINMLGISGSLRKASTNTGLLKYAQKVIAPKASLLIADLTKIPFYNADLSTDQKPEAVVHFFEQLKKAQALVFACAEYNYSLAPALKNALDWASKEPDNHLLAGKPVAIMGSGGGMGSSRAQYHLRQVCVYLDLHPLNRPEVFVNAYANTFDEQGHLTSEEIQSNVQKLLETLCDHMG